MEGIWSRAEQRVQIAEVIERDDRIGEVQTFRNLQRLATLAGGLRDRFHPDVTAADANAVGRC